MLTPLMHDTPAELAQPFGVAEWNKGECELIPGKTAPQISVVERDYPNTYARFTALGPLMDKAGNGGKGIGWNTQTEVGQLKELNGQVHTEGVTKGCLLYTSSPTSTPWPSYRTSSCSNCTCRPPPVWAS